jgi:4-diphosphocytidyl-2-C-methyl-D-erythritol kinase
MKHFHSSLAVKSFAKLNLYLQVLNKRQDNFHNLSTLFCRIDLADTVIFKNRKDGLIKIKCDSRQVPGDKTNLCWRAAELLKQELKLDSGLDIEIKKRIPVGAGLGGGSANAASVLLGLNKYWKLKLSKKKLANLGAKLGSDVPFFIYNTKFALGGGRGDKIKPLAALDNLKLWFMLIYPKVKVSTPLIYQKFDDFSGLTRPRCDVKMLTSELLKNGSRIDPKYFFNSLEIVTTSLYPVVNQVKNAFSGMGLEKIMMSGSGPAVFALCNGPKQARDLRKKLVRKYKSWQVFVTSTI